MKIFRFIIWFLMIAFTLIWYLLAESMASQADNILKQVTLFTEGVLNITATNVVLYGILKAIEALNEKP